MKTKKEIIILVLILIISAFLRFYNLMHDSPYFFNPDERNMANAVSGLRLPSDLSQIPICLIRQFSPILKNDPGSSSRSNDPGSPPANCNLNPHFFAYGQFPLYLAFASDQFIRAPLAVLQGVPLQTSLQTSFPSAIFWLRFWSAVSSVFTVLMVYLITNILINRHSGKRGTSASRIPMGSWTHSTGSVQASQDDKTIRNWKLEIGHYAAILAAFSPGLIQSAHFGTTESLLTFFFLASIYLSLRYLSNLSRLKFVFLNSFVIGLALGSKLTGIFFFIPPVITLIIRIIGLIKKKKRNLFIGVLEYWSIGVLILIGSISVFILSSPYNLVEPEDFKSAVFGYEQDVATGKYEAFYTRQFVNTTPIFFQAEKIFPYTLGWPVFILGSLGVLFLTFGLLSSFIKLPSKGITNYALRITGKNNLRLRNSYFVILTSFFIYLLPNASVFAKWTRFVTPIFPFFAIFAGYTVYQIYQNLKLKTSNFKLWFNALRFTLYALLIFPGIAFMSIYTHEDSRLTASKWIYGNIPQNSYILSETANVVDIPVGLKDTPGVTQRGSPGVEESVITNNYTVISFDFYHLDENPLIFNELLSHLSKADYIFIPSRRIFANYTKLAQKYPLVTKYYQLLFSGALGFEKINEINSFPKLEIGNWKLEIDDEHSEETYTVFDHPVIRIYKKLHQYNQNEYRTLLTTARID